MLSAGYLIPPKRHHVANTFKAEGDHVQGLREPFSRPRFQPLIVRQTDIRAQEQGQGNGYGRYCNHYLHRTLPRTSPDVADLLSARHLTAPLLTAFANQVVAAVKNRQAEDRSWPVYGEANAPGADATFHTSETKPFGSLGAAAGDPPKRRPWRSHRNFPRAQRELFLS